MELSIDAGGMHEVHVQALSVVILDVIHYAERSARPGGTVRGYLVIAPEEGRWIAALGFDGDVNPVSTLLASYALRRVRLISNSLSGEFQRGGDGSRMVFGLTFPIALPEDLA